jgi:hypothetical protein
MGKWDTLPTEILRQIIDYTTEPEKVRLGYAKWMLVNQQWFDVYQYHLLQEYIN